MAAEVRRATAHRQEPALHEAPVSRVRIRVSRPQAPPGVTDDLRAARGILVSVLIGAALWIAIAGGARLIAH